LWLQNKSHQILCGVAEKQWNGLKANEEKFLEEA
jgi:hypothetical protein